MNAKEMYNCIYKTLENPTVSDIAYSWRREGFIPYGDEDVVDVDWTELSKCSDFMDKVIRALPFYLRFDYFLHKKTSQAKPRIYLEFYLHTMFSQHYGVSPYDLEDIIRKSDYAVYDESIQEYGPPKSKNVVYEIQKILNNGFERMKELQGKDTVFIKCNAQKFGFDVVKETSNGREFLVFNVKS